MAHPNQRFLDDLDLPHVLRLSIVPPRHGRPPRARMIRYARMECVVEVFSSRETGGGQIYPHQLDSTYALESEDRDDLPIMERRGTLPSYDVYSLRVGLREPNIDVNNAERLTLSAAKKEELSVHMTQFTRPLPKAFTGTTWP